MHNGLSKINPDIVRDKIVQYIEKNYTKAERRKLSADIRYGQTEADKIERVVREFCRLNDALVCGRSVWCQPEKIGQARRYYSLLFVNEKGKVERFWPMELYKVFGMIEQNRDTSLWKWMFCTSYGGPFEATERLANFHRDCGAGYFQLSTSFL